MRFGRSGGAVPRCATIFALGGLMLTVAAGFTARAAQMEQAREELIETIQELAAETADETGIASFSPRVVEALRNVPREAFVPENQKRHAYRNRALPIGEGQTISQPYIVALMTELLQLRPGDKVLEIGTGSGYQAAILGELASHVYSIEIVEPLGTAARQTLERLGYGNITVRIGDGYAGWPEEAPFDAVIVTAAPPYIPDALIEQLKPGGRMVIPVGGYAQDLMLLVKQENGTAINKTVIPVAFVPMVEGGGAGK